MKYKVGEVYREPPVAGLYAEYYWKVVSLDPVTIKEVTGTSHPNINQDRIYIGGSTDWLQYCQKIDSYGTKFQYEMGDVLHKRGTTDRFCVTMISDVLNGYQLTRVIDGKLTTVIECHSKEYVEDRARFLVVANMKEVKAIYDETFTPAPYDPEPVCTCDSKLLFDEGCQCQYAAWKRRNK